jgi:hypothetical protein
VTAVLDRAAVQAAPALRAGAHERGYPADTGGGDRRCLDELHVLDCRRRSGPALDGCAHRGGRVMAAVKRHRGQAGKRLQMLANQWQRRIKPGGGQ